MLVNTNVTPIYLQPRDSIYEWHQKYKWTARNVSQASRFVFHIRYTYDWVYLYRYTVIVTIYGSINTTLLVHLFIELMRIQI